MNPIEEFEDIRQHKLERCGEETALPGLLKYLPDCSWQKEYTTVKELMDDDSLQMTVSSENTWTYELWNSVGTTQFNEIAKNWDTIKSYLPDSEFMKRHTNRIGPELTNLVLYNSRVETGVEFPLYIVNNNLMLPLIPGSDVDGNHRHISLLNSLVKAEIREYSVVPIWKAAVPNITMFGYNLLALFKLQMPYEKKLELIEERILVGKKK